MARGKPVIALNSPCQSLKCWPSPNLRCGHCCHLSIMAGDVTCQRPVEESIFSRQHMEVFERWFRSWVTITQIKKKKTYQLLPAALAKPDVDMHLTAATLAILTQMLNVIVCCWFELRWREEAFGRSSRRNCEIRCWCFCWRQSMNHLRHTPYTIRCTPHAINPAPCTVRQHTAYLPYAFSYTPSYNINSMFRHAPANIKWIAYCHPWRLWWQWVGTGGRNGPPIYKPLNAHAQISIIIPFQREIYKGEPFPDTIRIFFSDKDLVSKN